MEYFEIKNYDPSKSINLIEVYRVEKGFDKCCIDLIKTYINNDFISNIKIQVFNRHCGCGQNIRFRQSKLSNNRVLVEFYKP